MNRLLQSSATVVILGGLMFYLTMFVVLHTQHFGEVSAVGKPPLMAVDDPSWKFRNPDIDQWIAQMKDEREALALREQQLKEWEVRLAAESREISTVTQAVAKVQVEFDQRVLLFKDQEKENSKKQIKIIAGMTPEGAAAMLNQMSDDEVTKLLVAMKTDVAGAMLDSMSKLGQARRAAVLARRLMDVLPASATTNLTANASR